FKKYLYIESNITQIYLFMIPRTKVTTACQYCQTKKIKCSGPPECAKCREKNQVCNFITERKKRGPAPRTKRDVIESLATRRAKIGYRPSSFANFNQKSYANVDNIIELNLVGQHCINHISELENRHMPHVYHNGFFHNRNEVLDSNSDAIQLQVESHMYNLNNIEIEDNMNVEFLTPRTASFSSLSSRPHHNPLRFLSENHHFMWNQQQKRIQ
ncbi:2631_t:CDS:2, partial [Dentiscutata erythropus]